MPWHCRGICRGIHLAYAKPMPLGNGNGNGYESEFEIEDSLLVYYRYRS